MRVLLVGGGGREHALAWALSKSPRLSKLWAAPGNAGIAEHAERVPIAAEDVAVQALGELRAYDLGWKLQRCSHAARGLLRVGTPLCEGFRGGTQKLECERVCLSLLAHLPAVPGDRARAIE